MGIQFSLSAVVIHTKDHVSLSMGVVGNVAALKAAASKQPSKVLAWHKQKTEGTLALRPMHSVSIT
ncbi:hypothetical protein GCM10022228_02810 [Halomonas cibimaris]|uniref:Uncharacterized protein n=1 Tax=Halomonas cibimaris TaxID=657012 RepID=A0ABP7L8Z7_9GAMM